jgi:hypothetical protein
VGGGAGGGALEPHAIVTNTATAAIGNGVRMKYGW